MNLNTLVQLLQNKVSVLQTARGQAYSIGDLNQLNAIDAELLETQNTITQLATLANISKAAASVNASLSDVAASGIDALQNPAPVVQGPSASAIFNGYDISAYATDPDYAAKIQTILTSLPTFTVVGDIDSYIQATTPGSPLTGAMVFSSAQQYGVDIPLMMAIMENDSDFGTLGIGASTYNPGNIGNTGSSTQAYPSWSDGVAAVANWLNNHRVVTPTTPISSTAATTATTTDATSTAAILPTTQVTTATSTATFVIPTLNATTTPVFTPTNSASTTPAAATATATTSPATSTATSTSTDPVSGGAATTTATSTDATTGGSAATTTLDFDPSDPGTASTTPPAASSTPPAATTTDPTAPATSTPPATGTTTPWQGWHHRRAFNPGDASAGSSTNATSTAVTPNPATTTPPVPPPASSTPPVAAPVAVPAQATSTPDASAASTTQAIRKLRVTSA